MGNDKKVTIKRNLLKLVNDLPLWVDDEEALFLSTTILANAIVLIEKGYDINQDLTDILAKYKSLEEVPVNIQILDKEDG